MTIATINPATGEVVKSFDPMSHDQIDAAIGRADQGFRELRGTSFAQRAAWMTAAADLLDAERDSIAADDDHRDGQDARLGQGRGGQVRHAPAASTPSTPRVSSPTSRPTPPR